MDSEKSRTEWATPWTVSEEAPLVRGAPIRYHCVRLGYHGQERCGTAHLRREVAQRHTKKLNAA